MGKTAIATPRGNTACADQTTRTMARRRRGLAFEVQPPVAPKSSMNWQMHTDFSPAVPRCMYRAAAEPHAFGRRRRGAAVQLDTGIAQGFRRAAADGELVLVRAPLDARGRAAQAQQHKHWLPRAIWCRAHSQVKNLPQRSPEQRARARVALCRHWGALADTPRTHHPSGSTRNCCGPETRLQCGSSSGPSRWPSRFGRAVARDRTARGVSARWRMAVPSPVSHHQARRALRVCGGGAGNCACLRERGQELPGLGIPNLNLRRVRAQGHHCGTRGVGMDE